MKAMNLIPAAERRQPFRLTNLSPATLVLIGGLCAALAVVAILVTINSRVGDRHDATADLQAQTAQKQAKLDAIAGNAATLAKLEQAASTVRTLDDARYDWPATFSRISSGLPAKTKLTAINGSLAGQSTTAGTNSGSAVQLTGCTDSLKTLASAMQRMRHLTGIDSVTLASATKGATGGTSSGSCPYSRSFQLSVGITSPAGTATTATPATGTTTGGTP